MKTISSTRGRDAFGKVSGLHAFVMAGFALALCLALYPVELSDRLREYVLRTGERDEVVSSLYSKDQFSSDSIRIWIELSAKDPRLFRDSLSLLSKQLGKTNAFRRTAIDKAYSGAISSAVVRLSAVGVRAGASLVMLLAIGWSIVRWIGATGGETTRASMARRWTGRLHIGQLVILSIAPLVFATAVFQKTFSLLENRRVEQARSPDSNRRPVYSDRDLDLIMREFDDELRRSELDRVILGQFRICVFAAFLLLSASLMWWWWFEERASSRR